MFCKFCGEPIDKSTMKCSGCGKSTGPLEGGIGFWDLAGKPAPVTECAPQPVELGEQFRNTGSEKTGEHSPEGRQIPVAPGRRIIALGAALLLVLAFFTVYLGRELRKTQQECAQLRAETLSPIIDVSEETTVAEETTVPEETTVAEETTVPEETTVADETAVSPAETIPDEVFRQPEDVALAAYGVGEEMPVALFEVMLFGEVESYTWEKYNQETGEWEALEEDYYSTEHESFHDVQVFSLYLCQWEESVYGCEYRFCIRWADGMRTVTDAVTVKRAG